VFLPARTVPQALCRLIDASCAVYQQAPATYPGGLGRGSSTPHTWAQGWAHALRKADGVRPRACAGSPAGACACREMIRMRIICRAACGPAPDGACAVWNCSTPERREEYDLADRLDAHQQHHQAVDAKAHATRRGHALLQGLHEHLVVGLGLLVAQAGQSRLGLETLALDVRVGEL